VTHRAGRTARRIVALNPTGMVSGAELVLVRYLAAALADGWCTQALVPDGPLAERLAAGGVDVVAAPDLKLGEGDRRVAAARALANASRSAALLRRTAAGADAVVVNGVLGLPTLRLARLAGLRAPAAWLVHDVLVRSDLRTLVRSCAPAVDLAIAVSRAAAEFPASCGLLYQVVRNGVVWPVDAARATTPGPAAARPVVGCNAVLTPWKGQYVLLDAAARLGPAVEVELIGATLPKDAAYRNQLEARAARPDLAGRVRMLGHLADPLDAMRDWTIAVSASVDPEAGSLAVLEAMSIGVPLVVTDHGGPAEFIGAAGLRVTPGDASELAAAIDSLLVDAPLRVRCAAAGRAAVARGLTVEASSKAFLASLDALARATPR